MPAITQVNFVAVLLAAVAAQVIAIVWYLPPVFGLRWATLIKSYSGLTDATLGANLGRKVIFWFVGFLINALALALLLRVANIHAVPEAIQVAVLVWLGLGAVFSSWPPIHAGFPWGVWLMNNGAYLLIQITMAAILALWGV